MAVNQHHLVSAEKYIQRASTLAHGADAHLQSAADSLASLNKERLDADACQQLLTLRGIVAQLQTKAAYACALYAGLEQVDPNSVVGYSPTGLERAL
jgi:hypothetical protein